MIGREPLGAPGIGVCMYGIQLSLSLSLIQVLRNEIFSPFGIFSFFLLEYLGRQGGSGARKGEARQGKHLERQEVYSYYNIVVLLVARGGWIVPISLINCSSSAEQKSSSHSCTNIY